MTSGLLTTGDSMAVPCAIKEGILTYLGLWLGIIFCLFLIFLLFWRVLGKLWFWLWDHYIERQRPLFVFKNYRNMAWDTSLPIYKDSRFNFSKRLFPLDGIEDWNPGLLKIKRRITLGKEVFIRGIYRPKGGGNPVTFDLDSRKRSEHRIKGLGDDTRDDYVFIIDRNPMKKETI